MVYRFAIHKRLEASRVPCYTHEAAGFLNTVDQGVVAMSHPRSSLVLIACLAFLNPSSTAHGETPPKENTKTARTDRYGDPLPDDVMVRLGTTRLRHSDEVRQVAFAPDGKSVVSCDDLGWVRRWDTATGKRLRSFRAV